MMGKLHAVSVSMGFQTSTYKQANIKISSKPNEMMLLHRHVFVVCFCLPTLKVFTTYKASVDVDVGERDGAQFLKVKVQYTPGG